MEKIEELKQIMEAVKTGTCEGMVCGDRNESEEDDPNGGNFVEGDAEDHADQKDEEL